MGAGQTLRVLGFRVLRVLKVFGFLDFRVLWTGNPEPLQDPEASPTTPKIMCPQRGSGIILG